MKLSASRCVLTLALVISSLVLTASMSAQTLTLGCASGVGELGVVYDSALVVNGGVAPYTFSILSGSLPSGLTLDASSGAITGTPADKGTFNYVAQVADASGSLAKVKCQIKVWPHVSIDCPPKAKNIGAIGEPFSVQIPTYPGVAPYTYSLVSGSLPPGLTLNPSTGVISGIPTQAGNFFYVLQVQDSLGATFDLKCEIKINAPLTLTCASSTGAVGAPYSSALVAKGGVSPYTYSIVSGSLPPGLTLNPSTGAITGTPTTPGTFNFTAQVVDATGSAQGTVTSNCSITISPAPITLACAGGTAQVGIAYSSALVASGGVPPYTFSIISGSLPPGLTLNASTGAITGTPTQAGTFNFTAQVVDSTGSKAGTATASCSIVVSPPAITLTCAGGTAQVGIAYSSALVASGGVPPYTFSIISGSLPPGLTLNASTGAITGTPTQAGTFNFTAQVVDSTGSKAGTTTASCSIVVSPPAITLTCAGGTAQVGIAYSSALVASGGVPPYTFSIISGSLPPGLTLNASTGAITGTPTQAGTFNFTAQVVDSTGSKAGTTTASCSIVVSPPAITLTCAGGTAQVGIAYSSALVASGGVPPYTFSIISGSLPPGLTLNASTGAITGTPTQAGTFNFTAQVVDSTGSKAGTTTASCSIVVSPPAITLTCAGGTAQVGIAYSSALVASGGVPPYTFSIISGSLPPGLTLNASTGAITGTPTQAGTFNFTAQVVDSTGSKAGTATASCSIVVSPPPITLTCGTTTGQVGSPYSSGVTASGGTAPYTFAVISGSLPPGLTLNSSTGAITGTPSSEGTFSFTIQVTDANGYTATASCTITIKTCGSSLTPITYSVSETSKNIGQIAWFNSNLTQLQGQIPTSDFQIFITGGKIAFGSTTLTVPDAVITFTVKVTCATTSFNTTFNRWETTLPLSAASYANEIFAAGLAYQIPSGFQGVSSVTWSADISSTAPSIKASWEVGVSNWLTSNQGVEFPALSESPFVPDYNGMEVNAAQGCSLCSGNSQDPAGAPEFQNRQYLLVSGGCGKGGDNWTGTFSGCTQPTQVCQTGGGGGGGSSSCPGAPINSFVQSGANFAAIGLDGVDFEVQGPITVTGNLAVGPSGYFHLSNNATLNSTLFADPSADVQIDWGSGLTGGVTTESLSGLKSTATNLAGTDAALSATQTINNIQSSVTVKGNGSQNVISVPGGINLQYGGTITIQGSSSDTFIFNVANGMYLDNGANIALSGVSAGQVMFNFSGSSEVYIGNANTSGVFLAPGAEIRIAAGNHTSEFISGTKLILDCNNTTVTAPSCSSQAGTQIVPYIQVNGGSWQQTATVTVSNGCSVNLGPQPIGGTWSWTGPNGYTSTSRQINNIPLSSGNNVYVATYTNSSGIQSTQTFTITVSH